VAKKNRAIVLQFARWAGREILALEPSALGREAVHNDCEMTVANQRSA
jgi:hypothetical protein